MASLKGVYLYSRNNNKRFHCIADGGTSTICATVLRDAYTASEGLKTILA